MRVTSGSVSNRPGGQKSFSLQQCVLAYVPPDGLQLVQYTDSRQQSKSIFFWACSWLASGVYSRGHAICCSHSMFDSPRRGRRFLQRLADKPSSCRCLRHRRNLTRSRNLSCRPRRPSFPRWESTSRSAHCRRYRRDLHSSVRWPCTSCRNRCPRPRLQPQAALPLR